MENCFEQALHDGILYPTTYLCLFVCLGRMHRQMNVTVDCPLPSSPSLSWCIPSLLFPFLCLFPRCSLASLFASSLGTWQGSFPHWLPVKRSGLNDIDCLHPAAWLGGHENCIAYTVNHIYSDTVFCLWCLIYAIRLLCHIKHLETLYSMNEVSWSVSDTYCPVHGYLYHND